MDLNRASVISDFSVVEEELNQRFSYLGYADDESMFEETDDINELKEKMKNLVATIGDYKSIVDKEKEVILKQLESQKDSYGSQIAELSQKVSSLQLENDKIRSALKQTLEEKNNVTKQLTSEKRQLQIEHADNLKTLAKELMNIEEKNTRLSNELKEERQRHASTKEQLKLTKKIIEQLESQLKSTKQEANERKQIDDLKFQLQQEISNVQNLAKSMSDNSSFISISTPSSPVPSRSVSPVLKRSNKKEPEPPKTPQRLTIETIVRGEDGEALLVSQSTPKKVEDPHDEELIANSNSNIKKNRHMSFSMENLKHSKQQILFRLNKYLRKPMKESDLPEMQ